MLGEGAAARRDRFRPPLVASGGHLHLRRWAQQGLSLIPHAQRRFRRLPAELWQRLHPRTRATGGFNMNAEAQGNDGLWNVRGHINGDFFQCQAYWSDGVWHF